MLFNPVTRDAKFLLEPGKRTVRIGFGRDTINGVYIVVRVFQRCRAFRALVLTLGGGEIWIVVLLIVYIND